MYCNQCGAAIGANDMVCPACGRSAIAGRVDAAARTRVGEHLHLLGILWMVIAVFTLIPGIVLVALSGLARAYMPGEVERSVAPMVFGLLSVIFFLHSLGSFAAGWGLIKVEPWGRAIALVMGFLMLLHPPFGTALGIYTLFVLLPTAAGDEYRRLAEAPERQKLRVVTSQGA